MRILAPSASLLFILAGCTGEGPTYSGTSMTDFFPFDGGRDAEYVNDDTTVAWHLLTHMVPETVVVDNRETATWEYRMDDGTLLYAVKWSVRSNQPVQIEAWADGTGEFVTFDPPIVVANAFMLSNDSVTTETGGMTFTSTYIGPEDCTVIWGGLEWEDCAHIRIDDGDGDDMAGPKFAGDYWLVTRYGQAWATTTGYAQPWKLSDYDWDIGA